MFQVGGKKAEQSRVGKSLRQEKIGCLAGIAGIADLHEVFADPGEDRRGICPHEPRQTAFDGNLDGKPGERLKNAAETPKAPFRTLGNPPELTMLEGEQGDEPVRLAVIRDCQQYGFTPATFHALKITFDAVPVNPA